MFKHTIALVSLALIMSLIAEPAAARTPAAPQSAACVSGVGPGIPPPQNLRTGIPGFHAAWYGQSGYPVLCPGERSTATVAFLNTGSRGWVAGRLGEVAYLGTWNPTPGQDQPSVLGGDGQLGSPNTGWPRYNRIADQPAFYVGPGQVAWFQFAIQAPSTPGVYRLYLRALIEGAQWLEDYGIFWPIIVPNATTGALPVTFGDGTHTLGGDIAAGTYRIRTKPSGCYWARLSGFGGTLAEIITNNFTSDVDVVTIAPTDRGFTSMRCGTWTNDLSPITTSPTAPFGAGTYIVGVDISAGTWSATAATTGCYWARLSGFGHALTEIIANDFGNAAPIVTIAPTDRGFQSSECGTWVKVG